MLNNYRWSQSYRACGILQSSFFGIVLKKPKLLLAHSYYVKKSFTKHNFDLIRWIGGRSKMRFIKKLDFVALFCVFSWKNYHLELRRIQGGASGSKLLILINIYFNLIFGGRTNSSEHYKPTDSFLPKIKYIIH